jgi:hypothetical protein
MVAQALVVVLEQCKNDLSRENIMAPAANLKEVPLPLLMPGVKLNTSPKDYRPIKDGYLVEFRDNQFNVISELLRVRELATYPCNMLSKPRPGGLVGRIEPKT